MSGPLVSCIIPVFNGERFLADALDSVLAQTYRPLEIIVVDDGSTDATGAVLDRYADRVVAIRQANRGVAAARNTGVRASTGDVIAFLDADDLWSPRKLDTQMARMAEAPSVDLSFTHFQNFWAPEQASEARRHQGQPVAQPSAAWSICTLLARRDVFERFGPFDEQLRRFPNMTWFVNAAKQGAAIDVLPQVLTQRRVLETSVSANYRDPASEEFFSMLRAWRDFRQTAR